MEAWAWNFFISSLLSVLTKHSCQGPVPDPSIIKSSSNPVVPLPSASSSRSISYESLHYPGTPEQYQAIPLVINTGKIPLINHAIQAPIHYFVPNNGENNGRSATTYDSSAQHSPTLHRRRHQPAAAHPETIISRLSSPPSSGQNDAENRQSYDGNDNHYRNAPTTTTVVHSETAGVEGQLQQRYGSYGYKIIDDNVVARYRDAAQVVGPMTSRHDYDSSSGPGDPTKRDFIAMDTIDPSAKLLLQREAPDGRKPDRDSNDPPRRADNIARGFKPIAGNTATNSSTTKIELKKKYKETTTASPENPTEVMNTINGKFTKI